MNKIKDVLDIVLKTIGTILGIGACILIGGLITFLGFLFFLMIFLNSSANSIIIIPFVFKIGIIGFFTIMWIVNSHMFYKSDRSNFK